MMPVTKFICDKCGEVKDLIDAKVQDGLYVCSACSDST